MANTVWKDRKRTFLGLPWSFTRYELTEEKLHRPLGQRILGLGTIHLCTADRSAPEMDIKRIKKPKQVRDILSDMVEHEREERRIGAREYLGGAEMDDDCDCGHEH